MRTKVGTTNKSRNTTPAPSPDLFISRRCLMKTLRGIGRSRSTVTSCARASAIAPPSAKRVSGSLRRQRSMVRAREADTCGALVATGGAASVTCLPSTAAAVAASNGTLPETA